MTDLETAAGAAFAKFCNPDRDSAAYRSGYRQGLNGRRFFNPCEGNPIATDNHYWGFIKGESERTGALKAVA